MLILILKTCLFFLIQCVEALVTAGAQPSVDAAWNAAYCEHWPATLYLLEHGVSIEALQYVRRDRPIEGLFFFCLCGSRDAHGFWFLGLVRRFRAKTGDLVKFFVDRGMLDGVKYAIAHLPAPTPAQQGEYFRNCCVSDRCLEIVKFMVEKWEIKPDQFETDERFASHYLPQHIAAGCYAPKVLQYLLDLGANVNAVSMGMTPAFLNSASYKALPGSTGSGDDILTILENHENFDINTQIPSTGNTVLHSQWFMSTFLKRRLSMGADPYIKNKEGKTVLDIVNEQTNNLFEEALRIWKMFSLGKLKYAKKNTKRARGTHILPKKHFAYVFSLDSNR